MGGDFGLTVLGLDRRGDLADNAFVMTNVLGEPNRWLIRPGQHDHRELERLLTPGYWQRQPANLDGIVLDAPFAHRMGEPLKRDPLREVLRDAPTAILVDHHAYRLADGSWLSEAVKQLPYSPSHLVGEAGRGFLPSDFGSPPLVKRFVKCAFDFQHALSVSDYMAPAFYLDGPNSEWLEPNRLILQECVRQAGTFLFATFCGSLAALEDKNVLRAISENASSAYVLVSPMDARESSVTKLLRYVRSIERLKASGLSVVTGRQPAFGLALMAVGCAGFDSGLAQIEAFDYRSLVREVKRDGDGRAGGGRSRPVYVSKLMSSLPRGTVGRLLAMAGMKSQLGCDGLCCRDNMTDALRAAREHFLWSRLREVQELRDISPSGRVRHVRERLAAAHQFAKSLKRLVPDEPWDFGYLDNWSRVVEVVGASAVGGRGQ